MLVLNLQEFVVVFVLVQLAVFFRHERAALETACHRQLLEEATADFSAACPTRAGAANHSRMWQEVQVRKTAIGD